VPLQSTRTSPPSARSFSGAAPSRRSRAVPEPCGPASPGVLAPTNTFTSGAPSPPRTSFRSPVGDGSRQTPVGAVLRVLAPLDGSGQHAARSRPFDPAVRRGPRRFAAFFHAARVPGTSLQSFPFPGIRTRSRGPILPCGFRVRLPPAQSLRDLRCRFRRFAPALCPLNPPGGGPWTHEPGRRFLAIASPVASACSVSMPHVPSPSHRHWARRLAAGTPASKLCSPRESVLRRPRYLARLRPPVGALLGFLPSRALSTTARGSVSRRVTRGEP